MNQTQFAELYQTFSAKLRTFGSPKDGREEKVAVSVWAFNVNLSQHQV